MGNITCEKCGAEYEVPHGEDRKIESCYKCVKLLATPKDKE